MDLTKIIEAQKQLISKLDENKKEALQILEQVEQIQTNLLKEESIKKRISEDLYNHFGTELKTVTQDRSQFKVLERSNIERKIIIKNSKFQKHKDDETHWFTLRENSIDKCDGVVFTLDTIEFDFVHIVLSKQELKEFAEKYTLMDDGRINIGFDLKSMDTVYSSKGNINFSHAINNFSIFE